MASFGPLSLRRRTSGTVIFLRLVTAGTLPRLRPGRRCTESETRGGKSPSNGANPLNSFSPRIECLEFLRDP